MRPQEIFWKLVLTLGLFCTCTCHANSYRWIDEKGVTHYADAPPIHEGSRKNMKVISSPPAVLHSAPVHKWRIETEDGSKEFETSSDHIIVNSDGNGVEIITEPAKTDKTIEKMLRKKGAH